MSTEENLQIQSPYLFQVRENKDQKKLEIWVDRRADTGKYFQWRNNGFVWAHC